MTTGGVPTDRVAFHFDPMCPYAYRASLWIREVRHLTGLEIDWRFFSLEEINREPGKKHPWEREWSYGWSPMRIGAWLRRIDMDLLDRWYLMQAGGLHERGEQTHTREACTALVRQMGLDVDVVEAALEDPTTHDDVKADHDHVVGRFAAFGVPTLVFGDTRAIFGPVLVPVPSGEAALRLWDLTTGWLEFPGLYEMRKPKTAEDHAAIGTAFAPYLAGRAWQTVQREVE
ncbi:MAG: DsbA family protein [Acidimicrobiia bacterium]|nr:DsbA family protein [Acidimicrobiia bacterium]